MIDRNIVLSAINTILGRPPVSSETLNMWLKKESLEEVIISLVNSKEFIETTKKKIIDSSRDNNEEFKSLVTSHEQNYFRPIDLENKSLKASRILIIGRCLLSNWGYALEKMHHNSTADHLLFNNFAGIPEEMPRDPGDYLFQIVQIPARSTVLDAQTLKTNYSDIQSCKNLLNNISMKIPLLVESIMKYNKKYGILTFYCNFLTPQTNFMGRLFPRYDERNTIYLYEKLNEMLSEEFGKYDNCYLLDVNNISNALGKKYIQDDAVWLTSHGGTLGDFDHSLDQQRLEPQRKMSEHYPLKGREFIEASLNEAFAMQKTIAQENSVKLVVTDLDDTLWRGVIGDQGADNLDIEGWPLGYIEALTYLRRRGLLLGIISKNTEQTVIDGWNKASGGHISLDDFAIRRINWNSKVENMMEILSIVNLLPRNVVYIDDNPVERAAMQAAFPDMRILGANPYYFKRILLWSAETQVATITAESSKRTEMIQAQAERESVRQAMPREKFLETLNLVVSIESINSLDNPRFARCFELVNKTNQFNTTGLRWTRQMCSEHFAQGGHFISFSVKDIYTEYGLVGVLIVKNSEIVQFVMSCRVVGLDVEKTVLASTLNAFIGQNYKTCTARFVKTDANLLCRELYSNAGFIYEGEIWRKSLDKSIETPGHLAIEFVDNTSKTMETV